MLALRGTMRARSTPMVRSRQRQLAALLAAAHTAIFAAAGRGPQGRRWEQMCSATNPNCRVPLEFRTDQALNQPETPEQFPPGHLKPLGHPDFAPTWAGEIDVLDEMTPETFWTEYYPLKPFVLKGWGKGHPAMTKWKDDDYIIDNFGHHKVKIELKNEDRLTDYCGEVKFGERVICPQRLQPYVETYMNMSRFMKRYRAVDKFDHYVITQLPAGMSQDVGVVSAWNCGHRDKDELAALPDVKPWQTQFYEANLWISYNEGENFSSSVIHYDMNHQMMCLYDGKKEWITWDLHS
eukprot:SAG22_NODE_5789_length_952_cov_1.004689_1_plen_293_part_01